MAQTAYNIYSDVYALGQFANSEFKNVESYLPYENLLFGRGVVLSQSDNKKVRYPLYNLVTLTYSADFVTSNSIAVTVNGTALTQAFDTDHATTFAALVAKIEALDNVTATGNATTRVITILGTDVNVVLTSLAVTGGATQATSTVVESTQDVFLGLTVKDDTLEQDNSGNVYYKLANLDMVSTCTRGRIVVYVEEAVTPLSSVYLRYKANGTGKTTGQFRKDADSSKAVLISNARFKSTTSAAGLVELEINNP